MKHLILSDIHSNLEALQAVFDHAGKLAYDSVLCLGDHVGYGADPNDCVAFISGIDNAKSLQGNHDLAATNPGERMFFNAEAAIAVSRNAEALTEENIRFLRSLPLVYSSHEIFMGVHASPYRPKSWNYVINIEGAGDAFEAMEHRVAFIGHSHYPVVFTVRRGISPFLPEWEVRIEPEERYIINVGSVGQPRDGDPRASYVLFDDEEEVARIFRVPYDKEKAAEKIINAGLPSILAERILLGY